MKLPDLSKYRKKIEEGQDGTTPSLAAVQGSGTKERKALVEMPDITKYQTTYEDRDRWVKQAKLDRVDRWFDRSQDIYDRAAQLVGQRDAYVDPKSIDTYVRNEFTPSVNVLTRDQEAMAQILQEVGLADDAAMEKALAMMQTRQDALGKMGTALGEEMAYWEQAGGQKAYDRIRAAQAEQERKAAAEAVRREEALAFDIEAAKVELERLRAEPDSQWTAERERILAELEKSHTPTSVWEAKNVPVETIDEKPTPAPGPAPSATPAPRATASPSDDAVEEERGEERVEFGSEAYRDLHNQLKDLTQGRQNTIDRLQQQIWEAERMQKVEGYRVLTGEKDFEQYAAPNADLVGAFLPMTKDEDAYYSYLNDINNGKALLRANRDMENNRLIYERYDLMTDEELKIYNYIYATQGKEAATEYREAIGYLINQRESAEIAQRWQGFADDQPLLSSLASVAMAPDKLRGWAYQTVQGLKGEEIDVYHPDYAAGMAQGVVRSQVSENLKHAFEWETGGKIAAFFYQTAMSISDSLLMQTMTGGLGGAGKLAHQAFMGGGAASDMTNEVLMRGGTQEQALQMGSVAGIAEMFSSGLA